MAIKFLRVHEVLCVRGRAYSTHYLDIANGLWTPGVRIGDRAVAWPEHEVELLNAARMAGKSKDEIRGLVKDLLHARKEAR